MQKLKDLLRKKEKNYSPTLEAMQKTVEFDQNERIDMLSFGCTLQNLANNCLHSSTGAKLYPITENDKCLLSKVGEDVVDEPSILFTRKADADKNHIRKSTNVCKPIVGIDASQLYPYSICHPIPTGLYTRQEFDAESQRVKPRQNNSRSFGKMVISYFQQKCPDCRFESLYTKGTQKKID